jgi:hypothetical protein
MPDDTTTRRDFALAPLGIEEVRERLEISPLLVGASDDAVMREVPSCTCKVFQPVDPNDGGWIDGEGMRGPSA